MYILNKCIVNLQMIKHIVSEQINDEYFRNFRNFALKSLII